MSSQTDIKEILDLLQVKNPSQEAMLVINKTAENLMNIGVSPANKSEFLYILAEKLELMNPKGAYLEAMRYAYDVARDLAE